MTICKTHNPCWTLMKKENWLTAIWIRGIATQPTPATLSPTHTKGLLSFTWPPFLSPFLLSHQHMVLQGCFITPPLTQIIGISFTLNNIPLLLSFLHDFSHIFCNTSSPKNVPLFRHDSKLLTILFLRYLSVHLPFAKPMPIIFARGIKRPCYPLLLNYFYEGGGDGKDLDNKQFTAPCPRTNCSPTFPLQLLDVVVVRRENY
jgi:hypothetical protein